MYDSKNSMSSLEEHLLAIQNQLDQQTWTIEDFFQFMKEKGYPFLVLLLVLPFCQPFQIPGLSVPFGICLIIIGLRMAIGYDVWWPQWIMQKKIPPKLLNTVISKSLSFIQFLSRFTSHRFTYLAEPSLYCMHGWFVVLMGFYLALPIPIPLSNLPGALALFFLALGLLENDGLFVIIAYIIGIILIFAIVLLFFWFKEWLTH